MNKIYSKVGVIGRFKPLHNGSAAMLESLCKLSDHLVIGIGSINKYDLRNPFTAEEVKSMIDSFLSKKFTNYSFKFIPDFGHIPEFKDGKRWKQEIISQFGELDLFVSGNDYVKDLLKGTYICKSPLEIIPKEKQIKLSGTDVRIALAKSSNIKQFVPKEVFDYLESNNLLFRFKQEFGESILSLTNNGYSTPKGILEEKTAIGGKSNEK